MPARVVKLIGFNYSRTKFDTLYVILDHQGAPPVLPLIYTTYLSRYGIVYESIDFSDGVYRERIRSLKAREISDTTIRSYIYILAKFLSHLDQKKKKLNAPGMDASNTCDEQLINDYLNEELPKTTESFLSLETHKSALTAYYNWLDYMNISPRLELRIYRKTRQAMAEKNNKQNYIQYVSKYWRMKLLNACTSLGEKLMMRMGYEVGLRTSELMGLRTSGKNNLLELFTQLSNEDFDHVHQFPYWLEGRYTKGSKSRQVYFYRDLLVDMLRYYNTERQWLTVQAGNHDSSFFLRTDQRFNGTGIGKEQASRVFHKRAAQAGLNPSLRFHDLRHTFATELFHAELAGPDGRETRSESAALIVVAQRLGHAIGNNGKAPPVTTRYIRMRIQMLEMEASN